MTTICDASRSLTQIGSGVPQYRSRDNAQSTLLSSHSPKRPLPVSGGCQAMPALSSLFNMAMISDGVFLGAPMPAKPLAS